MLPSTHTVESDFSVLKILKNDSRRSLSNYFRWKAKCKPSNMHKPKSAASAQRAQELVARQATKNAFVL